MTTCSMKGLLSDSFAGEWGGGAGDLLTPVLRTANFNDDGSLDYDSPAYRCIAEKKVKAKRLRRGDIILEKSGGTPNRPVGIVAYYDSDDEALCSNFNHVLRFDEGSANPFFMFHQLRWLREKGAFAPYTRKTTGLQNLQMKAFVELELVVPPKDEQDRAATSIRAIGSSRNELKKLLESLDELVKSRFVEMFGDADGEHRRLEDCCVRVVGGKTPSMKHPEYYGGDIPFIKSGDVKSDVVSSGALWLSNEAMEKASVKLVPAGSVLVVVRSALLKRKVSTSIASCKVAINQDIRAFSPKPEFTSSYLLWSIRSHEQELLEHVRSVNTSGIDMRQLYDLSIRVEPIDKQREFAAFVRQVDKLKFEESYKVSLIPVGTQHRACILVPNMIHNECNPVEETTPVRRSIWWLSNR